MPEKLPVVAHTRWRMIEVNESEVPGLLELLEKSKHLDWVHGQFRDAIVRHGDDGGWCIMPAETSALYKRINAVLETIRLAADYPDHGEVFYLIVKRD